jgi:protein-S-isoprenylcysteine O-methyltransferase Ste14
MSEVPATKPPPSRIRFALVSIILTVLLVVGPVAFIRRNFGTLFIHWEETALYAIAVATSAASALFGFGLFSGEKETRRQRLVVWFSLVTLFLYVASAALCERLKVGTFTGDIWRYVGLVVFSLGCCLRLWSVRTLGSLHSGFVAIQKDHKLVQNGPYRGLRHPSYLGLLLSCIGLPMVFGAWFPLLAIPGIFVGLKWRMDDEEVLLREHFGDEYESYTKNRWRIIPFVY